MSKNRQKALVAVIALHILLGYAIVSGFAISVVKKIVEPMEAVDIKEEAPPPDEPPPPPPKDIEIPPYVPPPEVTVAQEAPAPTITPQTAVAQPDPPRVAPPAPPAPPAPAVAPTPATPKGRGNVFSDDDYPSASRAAEEEGVARVSYVVGEDGRVSACEIVQSSGFKRLDDATCNIIMRRFRFNPATRDGKPVAERKTQPVRWRLTN